jgi:hypothetical protein
MTVAVCKLNSLEATPNSGHGERATARNPMGGHVGGIQ